MSTRTKTNILSVIVIIVSLVFLIDICMRMKNEHFFDPGYSNCYKAFCSSVNNTFTGDTLGQLGYSIKKDDRVFIFIPDDMLDDMSIANATTICFFVEKCAIESGIYDHTDTLSVFFCEDGNDSQALVRFSVTKDDIKQY